MATNISYIGPGEENDYPGLDEWEDAVGVAGHDENQIVILTEDITDNLSMANGWNAVNITIKSDTPGVKRTVTSKTGGYQMIYAGDSSITSLTVEDLILDGTGQSSTKSGVQTSNGTDTVTLNRVHIKNVTQHSILIWSSSATTALDCDNCIFENPGGSGYRGARTTTTATFRNCLFVGCTGAAQNCAANASNIGNYYNCLSFGNTGDDFAHAGGTQTTNLMHCVSEDTTAVASHDVSNECVGSQAATGTYFNDYDNGDYTLRHDDFTNWGKNGSAVNTPATDFNYRTRTNDDIGPFEYVAPVGTGNALNLSLSVGL